MTIAPYRQRTTHMMCVCVCVRAQDWNVLFGPWVLACSCPWWGSISIRCRRINKLCWWQQRCGPTSGEDRGPCHDRPTAATVCSSCLWSWSLYLGTADSARNEHNCRLHGVKQQNHPAYRIWSLLNHIKRCMKPVCSRRFHMFLPTSTSWPLMNPNSSEPMIVMTLLNPM